MEDGRITGIETEFGAVDADTVIVAAGSVTPDLIADLPIRAFMWNAVYLDVDADASTWPAGGDADRQMYWRDTSSEDLLAGRENQTFSSEPAIDPEFERLVAEELPEFFEYDNYEVVRWEKCSMADATTPDGRAIIDAPDSTPGELVVAAGFYGAGMKAGFAIGDVVRLHVTGESNPPWSPRLSRSTVSTHVKFYDVPTHN